MSPTIVTHYCTPSFFTREYNGETNFDPYADADEIPDFTFTINGDLTTSANDVGVYLTSGTSQHSSNPMVIKAEWNKEASAQFETAVLTIQNVYSGGLSIVIDIKDEESLPSGAFQMYNISFNTATSSNSNTASNLATTINNYGAPLSSRGYSARAVGNKVTITRTGSNGFTIQADLDSPEGTRAGEKIEELTWSSSGGGVTRNTLDSSLERYWWNGLYSFNKNNHGDYSSKFHFVNASDVKQYTVANGKLIDANLMSIFEAIPNWKFSKVESGGSLTTILDWTTGATAVGDPSDIYADGSSSSTNDRVVFDVGADQGSIRPKVLTITDFHATSRTYDGTTATAITSITKSGLIDGDNDGTLDVVNVTGNATLSSKDVPVSSPGSSPTQLTATLNPSTVTLSGTDAGNYTVTSTTVLTTTKDISGSPDSLTMYSKHIAIKSIGGANNTHTHTYNSYEKVDISANFEVNVATQDLSVAHSDYLSAQDYTITIDSTTVTFTGVAGDLTQTAVNLASAIDEIPGFSATTSSVILNRCVVTGKSNGDNFSFSSSDTDTAGLISEIPNTTTTTTTTNGSMESDFVDAPGGAEGGIVASDWATFSDAEKTIKVIKLASTSSSAINEEYSSSNTGDFTLSDSTQTSNSYTNNWLRVLTTGFISTSNANYMLHYGDDGMGGFEDKGLYDSVNSTFHSQQEPIKGTNITVEVYRQPLTVTGVTVEDKDYDGDNTATISDVTFSEVTRVSSSGTTHTITGGSYDSVTITAQGTFDDASAGSGKSVSLTNFSLTDTSGSNTSGNVNPNNYTITTDPTSISSLSATINQLSITINITSFPDKTYDGNSNVLGITYSESISGVTTLNTTNYSRSDVGSTATANFIVDSNYLLSVTGDTSSTILAKNLILSGGSAQNKTYDGTSAATFNYSFTSGNEPVSGENPVSASTLTFDSVNAGTHTATASGFSVSSNYTLDPTSVSTITSTAEILKRQVGIKSIGDFTHTYNTRSVIQKELLDTNLHNVVSGDSVGLGVTIANLSTPSSSSVTISSSNFNSSTSRFEIKSDTTDTFDQTHFRVYESGWTNSNYTVTSGQELYSTTTNSYYNWDEPIQTNSTVTVLPRPLTITGMTADDKFYDGNNIATISDVTYNPVVLTYYKYPSDGDGTFTITGSTMDNVSISGVNATFDGTTSQADRTVTTSGFTINSPNEFNYSITPITITTLADILGKPIHATIVANDKTYDGTNVATASSVSLTGLIPQFPTSVDPVTSTFTFDSADVSSSAGIEIDKTVTAVSLALSDTVNYVITNTPSAPATIFRRDITVPSITALDKTYDSTDVASVTVNYGNVPAAGYQLTGSDYSYTATFDDEHQGLRTATLTEFSQKPNNNYNILGTPLDMTDTATIEKKPLTLTKSDLVERHKVWDGNPNGVADIKETVFIYDDDVTGIAQGTYVSTNSNDPNYWSSGYKVLNIASPLNIILSGTDAENYLPTGISNLKLTPDPVEVCFYGWVKIMTPDGYKEIKSLRRGDLVATNEGYQKVAKITCSNVSDKKNRYVKITKGCLGKNLPCEDVIVTHNHPLSIGVLKNNKGDCEYIHINPSSFCNNLIPGIDYIEGDLNQKEFNLVFDRQYEMNVCGIKFLSHHPNNWKFPLKDEECINKENRSKVLYTSRHGRHFVRREAEDLLEKNEVENNIHRKKIFFRNLLRFKYRME